MHASALMDLIAVENVNYFTLDVVDDHLLYLTLGNDEIT